MGQTVTRTCDYDGGCEASETLTSVDYDDWEEEAPMETEGRILWCRYEPEKHPKGQYLCREHEQQVRRERNITLVG